VEDSKGCTKILSVNINDIGGPSVTLDTFTDLCANSGIINLTGGKPAGGTYEVDGTISTTFNPRTEGSGTYSISYSYTNAGCTSSDIQTITVNSVPDVTMPAFDVICKNTAAIALNSGYPAGGTYKLDGAAVTSIDPSITSAGNHKLVYTYTDANQCSNSDTTTIKVRSITPTTLAVFSNLCTDDDPIKLSGGSPSGGVYKVDGLTDTIFNPFLEGAGTYNIDYIYTDANSCSDTAMQPILVSVCTEVISGQNISAVNVYPNPTDGLVTITIKSKTDNVSVRIFDIEGQMILNEEWSGSEINRNIDFGIYKSGIYTIQVITGDEVINTKLILAR
jgi:hypothetical protein